MAMKVVGLEGGPCSGKTTAMEHLVQIGEQRGTEVVTIPETATEMIVALGSLGLTIADIKQDQHCWYGFQKELQQRNVQKILDAKSIAGKDALIVHDRPDSSSYISPEEHQQICTELGFDQNPTYSLVNKIIFIHSMASTNPVRYERLHRSNAARFETLEEAEQQDRLNESLLWDHPRIRYVHEPSLERMLYQVAWFAFTNLEYR